MKISRLKTKDLSFEAFQHTYLRLEEPVIIEGVKAFQIPETSVDSNFIKSKYKQQGEKVIGWYNLPLLEDNNLKIPEIVKRVLNLPEVSLRALPFRIFMQPKGNHTLPHYDGNSLCGFNLQIAGRKKWTITSPQTPLPTSPFNFLGSVHRDFQYSECTHTYYEFETVPGDLLFLPRYWFHEVVSLEEFNLNLNWVFTPRYPNLNNHLGRREAEILKIRDLFPFLNDWLFIDDFSNYGGAKDQIVANYSRNVGAVIIV